MPPLAHLPGRNQQVLVLWWRNRESRNSGKDPSRHRPEPAARVVHACFKGFARNPGTVMASVLPFRPWFSPALRVFRSRTARGQSTDPSLDLSCTFVPPQRIVPKPVARLRKPGRPCSRIRTPRFTPRPFSMSERKNPSFRPVRTGRLKGAPRLPKVPPSGFGYPLDGVRPSALGSLFQLPTLLGFPLQSLAPALRPTRGFPRMIRPCAFPPDRSA
jgi:hypothetical protein